ncbi:CsbD family protein [Ramlibacter sp. PS4R-6]|uniref:CsbD family protein n=1 Tax=Ramlibacter sp. PS4R-6 TaxID=3133438 RepID=UPI0030ACD09A
MNQDRIKGQWKQVKGKIKEQWGRLTEDDLDVIAGKRDQLLGRIQERHGIAKAEANRQVQDFEQRNPDVSLDDTPARNQS